MTGVQTCALPISALNNRAISIVDFHVSDNGAASFGFAAPVFEPEEAAIAPIGVLYLEMGFAPKLERILKADLGVYGSTDVAMVKLEGDEAVHLTLPRGGAAAPPLSMRKSIRDGEFLSSQLVHVENATFLRGKNYDGKQVLGVGALIPGTRWYLVVQTDADELLSPIRQAAGVSFVTILAMIAILLVTVRLVWRARQAEYAATQSAIDARYLAARESSIDGYIVFDATGRIMEVNAAMARISGFTVNELKEKSITNWDMEGLRAGSTIAEIREKRSARLRLQ